MKLRLFLALALIGVMASCGSVLPPDYQGLSSSMMHADVKMKNVTLGMSKEQVVSIMGEHFEMLSAKDNTFVLGYKSYDYGIYKLYFINGKLAEWTKEWLPANYDKNTSSYNPDKKTNDTAMNTQKK